MTQEAKKSNDAVTMSTANVKGLSAKLNSLIPSGKVRTIILVGLIIIGGFVYANTNKPSKIPPFNRATILILKGGKYDDAIKILDSAIRDTSNKNQIAELNLQKASVSISTAHLDKALTFAKKAESTYPTSSSSSMIAEIAKIQDNKKLAIQWYETTLKRLDKNTQGYDLTVQELNDTVKALSQ